MKKVLPAFLIVIFSSCYSQPGKVAKKAATGWQACYLKGKVRSVTECNYKDYVPAEDFVTLNIYKFDSVGNNIDKAMISKDGNFVEHTAFLYDKNGHAIEMKYYSEDGRYSRTVYKYDNVGNPIETISYDKNGRLESTTQSSYDQHGNEISLLHKGTKTYREVYAYEYDAQNRMISKKRDAEKKTLYKYNKDTVEEISFGYYGEEHVKDVYNRNGQYLFRKGLGDTAGVSRPFENTYKYDAAGNVTEIKQTEEGKVLKFPYSERFEYVYDEKGNWIKRTTMTLDGKPMNSVERKIEYY